MQLNINELLNTNLVELAWYLNVETVERLSSTDSEEGAYSLYRVSNILAIEHNDNIIPDWNDEFEGLYLKHFGQESNKR